MIRRATRSVRDRLEIMYMNEVGTLSLLEVCIVKHVAVAFKPSK